jgi:sugar phosphate isomerase/epimerase
MVLGLHTDCYLSMGPKPAPWFLERAEQAGLQGVQLSADLFGPGDYSSVFVLRARAEERGLHVELAASGWDPAELGEVVRAAHLLGCGVVRVAVGEGRPADPDDLEDDLQRAAVSLRSAAALAKRYDIWLAVENHRDMTSGELLRFISTVDEECVRVCLDTGNSLAVLEDPVAAAAALAPHALTVHLKDYRVVTAADGVRLVPCPLGEGVVDLQEILKIVLAQNPTVQLNIQTQGKEVEVPCLEDEFLASLTDRRPEHLAAILRLRRDAPSGRGDESPPDVAVRKSADLAREILGQRRLPLEQ